MRLPGEYPLLEATGVRYLIDLAGGLRDGAFLSEVEVRRLEIDPLLGTNTRFLNLNRRTM